MDKRIAVILKDKVFTPQQDITAWEVSQVVCLIVAAILRPHAMEKSEVDAILNDLGLCRHFKELEEYQETLSNE